MNVISSCVVVLAAVAVAGCGRQGPQPGTVQDEAMRAGLTPEHFAAAPENYFHDMDFNLVGHQPLRPFTQQEIEGRNPWLVWTGGNDRLWDRLTIDSLGTFDLLKTISSHPQVRYNDPDYYFDPTLVRQSALCQGGGGSGSENVHSVNQGQLLC